MPLTNSQWLAAFAACAAAAILPCVALAQTVGGAVTEGLALATQRNCMACHQVDVKRVGPSLRAVAERFSATPEASEAYLAQAIRQGGRGRWGAIPMPSQPQVSEAEAQALARWILTLDESPAKP